MSRWTKANIRGARVAAARLEAIGEKKLAEDVRRLDRSNASYRQNQQRLWRDNMRLRKMISEIDPR